MEVVTDPENRKEVIDYLTANKDKKMIGTIDAVDWLHDGHLKIFKDVKERSDILVVEYSQFWSEASLYYKFGVFSSPKAILSKKEKLENFVEKLEEIEDYVDFMIYSPMTPQILEKVYYLEREYKQKFIDLHNKLGIPGVFHLGLTYALHSDVIPACTKAFAGGKNVIMDLGMRTIVKKEDTHYYPETIWNVYRQPTGEAFARTSSNPTLGYMSKQARSLILTGKADINNLQEVHKSVFLRKPEFSIIDLSTCEKLDQVTDNCAIILADDWKTEHIFLKNGNLIM